MKILIGSCGGLTGYYLAKYLRKLLPNLIKSNEFLIYGSDSSDVIPTKRIVNKLFVVPHSKYEQEFLNSLITIINSEKVDIYIPTHSTEVRVISKHEEFLRNKTSVKFLISPKTSFEILDNKLRAYKFLNNTGIKTPKFWEDPESIEFFPVIAKTPVSSASKNIFITNSREEAYVLKKKYKEIFFSEYLNGKEYTVDAFFNKKGELVTYNQRIRIKTIGGAAVISQNNFDIDVKDELEIISKNVKIIGPANFQFFNIEGTPVFTDINLRFASGGLPLSVESGANIVKLLILELLNIPYNKEDYTSDRKNRIMYRYFEEWYETLN